MNTDILPSLTQVADHTTNQKIVFVKLKKSTDIVAKVSYWSWVILIVASFVQCFFFWSIPEFVAIICVIIAWIILTSFFLKEEMLRKYPLSTFMIIGFTATQLYFPLVFTTTEFKPVIFNLDLPYQVFFHSLATLIVLVIAHYIYRFFPQQTKRQSSWLYRLGFFKAPDDLQLWIIGIIGLFANIYVFFVTNTTTLANADPSNKVIQSLFPFAYAPYLIPVKAMFGSNKKSSKRIVLQLVIWASILFFISMARNNRTAFMIGFTSIAFSYILGLLLEIFEPPKIAFKTIAIAAVCFWIVTGPIADLGTAMVIVRSQRENVTKAELIDITIAAFNDKTAIAMRRLQDRNAQSLWDERYLDNIFTARFANIKFNDATLVQAERVGEKNPKMLRYSTDYMWGALPDPILKVVNPNVNKEFTYSISFGDYIYSLAGAGKEVFGGYRTGHMAGTGMAAFGLWYLAILGVLMIFVFLLFDKLCLITDTIHFQGHKEYKMAFSVCSLLILTSVFQFLPTESVSQVITFMIRGYLQILFIYLFIYHATKQVCNLIYKF